ncbi:MAG: pGP6-D family virulence protein [Simkaniaceae bacterium]
MSKKSLVNQFFTQTTPSSNQTRFNLVTEENSFKTLFEVKPLDEEESKQIENLLWQQASKADEKEIEKDIFHLKEITAQIKSIDRQAVVLIGERIYKAKQIFHRYGGSQKTFSWWLKHTFGSRTAPYQSLRYFEFYQALPNEDLQKKFKQMPLKAGYILASREGVLEDKVKILQKFHNHRQEEIIPAIRKQFPLASSDKRQGREDLGKQLQILEQAVKKILKNRSALSDAQKLQLQTLYFMMKEACE